MKTLLLYLTILIVLVVLDLIWLGYVARSFFRDKLGFLIADHLNWFAIVLFYLLYSAALLFFVVHPALVHNHWQSALLSGLFFGCVCYATYDLTNWATIANWPAIVVWVDVAWGSIMTGLSALAAYYVGEKL